MSAFEHRWDDASTKRDIALGRDAILLQQIPRAASVGAPSAAAPLRVESQLFDLSSANGVSNPSAALVTVAWESKGNDFDAPPYTSFGAFAVAQHLNLSKGKPEGSRALAGFPKLTLLNYGAQLKNVGSLFLLEVVPPAGLESVVDAFRALRTHAAELGQGERRTLLVPLLGANEKGTVGTRVVIANLIGLAFELSRSSASLESVVIMLPSRKVQDEVHAVAGEGDLKRALDALARVSLAPLVERVRSWAQIEQNVKAYPGVCQELGHALERCDAYLRSPKLDLERQMSHALAATGLRIAESSVEQFAHVEGYVATASLTERAAFLHGLADAPMQQQASVTSLDRARLTPRTESGTSPGARKRFINRAQYDSVELLEAFGKLGARSEAASILNAADSFFILNTVVVALGHLFAPSISKDMSRAQVERG
jgi:hypothetical protein